MLEADNERRVGNLSIWRDTALAHANLHKVVAITLGAEGRVMVAPSALRPRTAAAPQMPEERRYATVDRGGREMSRRGLPRTPASNEARGSLSHQRADRSTYQ
jgi:hypothetical protein